MVVTKTTTSSSSSSSRVRDPAYDEDGFETREDDEDGGEDEQKKLDLRPPVQVVEERMRDLQAEIAFHHRQGQYEEASRVSRDLLEASLDHFGERHPVTASAHNNVGLSCKQCGEYEESEERYHDALRIYGETVGRDHASYAAALNNLGNLMRTRCATDERLSGTARLTATEEAVAYFEEALQIRESELGNDHPYTVTSRTNLGAAMASMLLQEQANRTSSARHQKTERRGGGGGGGPRAPLRSTRLTASRWEAAEGHLRRAYEESVRAPRGREHVKRKGARIRTLAAANAAQSLAVVLKTRVDLDDDDHDGNNDASPASTAAREDALAEARLLYEGALEVRTAALPDSHPDVVATKFSLAELHETAYGDVGEEEANRLRREILDAYDVRETDGPPSADADDERP